MEFEHSTKVKELQARVSAFMEAHIYPNEKLFDQQLDEGDTRWPVSYTHLTLPTIYSV